MTPATLDLAARYLAVLQACEYAHAIGSEGELAGILAGVDPVDLRDLRDEISTELKASLPRDTGRPTEPHPLGSDLKAGQPFSAREPNATDGDPHRDNRVDSATSESSRVVHFRDNWSRKVRCS